MKIEGEKILKMIFIVFICLIIIFIINSYGLTHLKVIFQRIVHILM